MPAKSSSSGYLTPLMLTLVKPVPKTSCTKRPPFANTIVCIFTTIHLYWETIPEKPQFYLIKDGLGRVWLCQKSLLWQPGSSQASAWHHFILESWSLSAKQLSCHCEMLALCNYFHDIMLEWIWISFVRKLHLSRHYYLAQCGIYHGDEVSEILVG